MKFTVYVPKYDNEHEPFESRFLQQVIYQIWKPFRGMTDEGEVRGKWFNRNGKLFDDICVKISVECDRERLAEAIRRVKKAGQKLRQEAMFFEVSGYDGVQFLYMD